MTVGSASSPASRNTQSTYGSVERMLHWAVALLLITGAVLGKVAYEWPYDSSTALSTKATLFSAHKTVGISVFFLALIRIGWAVSQPRPRPLHPDRKWETALASMVHWLLYGSLVIVPLLGWIHHAASTGFAPIWWPFGQSLPFVPKDAELSGLFGELHELAVKVLLVALALHVAGTLKHVFIDRDLTLPRMWRGADPGALPPAAMTVLPLVGAGIIWAVTLSVGVIAADKPSADTHPVIEVEAPVETAANWAVRDGTLSLSVTQMGQAVTGQFEDWTALIIFDETAGADETFGSVTATIDVTSLSLGSVSTEAKAPDFLDAQTYPTAVFEADIRPGETGYVADGTLSLRGTTVPVQLPFDLTLIDDVAQMRGQVRLDRRDFGIGETYADETNVGFAVIVDLALTAERLD